ncbi:hypothetical protein Tco_0528056 [Tanacetum coccineum]
MFDQGLAKEIIDMKEVFNQMETEQIIFQDVMCTAMDAEFEYNCVLPANDNNLAYAELEKSVFLCRHTNEVCLLCEGESKQILALHSPWCLFGSSKPSKKAWGVVGLPTWQSYSWESLVEGEGRVCPWGGLGCRVKEMRTRASTYDSWNNQFMTRLKSFFLNTLCSTIQEDGDILFQLMFDEYFQPLSVVARAAAVAPIPIDTTVLLQDFEGQETLKAYFDNDPFANILNSYPSFEESSSRDVIESNLDLANQPFEHLSKWTKNHPLDNVISNPSHLFRQEDNYNPIVTPR